MISIITGLFALVSLIGFVFGFISVRKQWKNYNTPGKVINSVLLFIIFINFCLMVILTIYPKIISTL